MCKGCHVVSLEIEMRDREALAEAAKRLGGTLHWDGKPFEWWGSWAGDTEVPRKLFASEKEWQRVKELPYREMAAYMKELLTKNAARISFPGCAWEVGIFEIEGQLVPVWDYWGLDGKALAAKCEPLAQAYGVALAELTAKRQGQVFQEIQETDGSITVHVHVQE
jgi:hypothetical protein